MTEENVTDLQDLEKQAYALGRNCATLRANRVDRVFHYSTIEHASEIEGSPFGLWTTSLQPRPAVFGYAAMTSILGPSRFSGFEALGGVRVVRMSLPDGHAVIVAWDDEGRTVARPHGARAYDFYGNPIAAGGVLRLGPQTTCVVLDTSAPSVAKTEVSGRVKSLRP